MILWPRLAVSLLYGLALQGVLVSRPVPALRDHRTSLRPSTVLPEHKYAYKSPRISQTKPASSSFLYLLNISRQTPSLVSLIRHYASARALSRLLGLQTMDPPRPPAPPSGPSCPPVHERWELLKDIIEHQYINEKRKLPDLAKYMKDHHDFDAGYVACDSNPWATDC